MFGSHGRFCIGALAFSFVMTAGTVDLPAQVKQPAALVPPTPAQGLKEGWEQIDQQLVFLTVELSNIESEIDATNKALKSNGYKLEQTNQAAEHARKGNELMDRNGGGPVAWKEFYGKTAETFFYHPTDGNTVHVNPLPLDQRPPQFDYIYRANLDNLAKAQEDADKIGGKIEDLLAHRAALESEQSALWCKIAFRAISSRELASQPMYRFDPTSPDSSDKGRQELAAVKAGEMFIRAIDSSLSTAQAAVATDQKAALDQLKQSILIARTDLQESLMKLPLLAGDIADPANLIGKFSRSAKRLADTSENLTDAFRMAGSGDAPEGQAQRVTYRGQFQDSVFDISATTVTADQSLVAAAKAWGVTPDTRSARPGSVPPTTMPMNGQSIGGKLDMAKSAFTRDTSEARRALIAAVDARLNAAADAGDLQAVESLQAAKTTAAKDGTIPDDCKDLAVLAAKDKMTQAIASANGRMATAYREAVRDYTRARQLTEARAAQDEFVASGLSSQTPAAVEGGDAQAPTGSGPSHPGTDAAGNSVFPPPTLPEGELTIDLPAAVDETAVGGGGRYLILHLKKLRQLAVFDVSTTKVLKYIPLPSNDIFFTAGQKKLFVGYKDLRQIQRWDIARQEMELSVATPEGGVGGLTMGADVLTPLVAIGDNSKHIWLMNPNTLKGEPYPSKNWGTEGSAWGPSHIHMSFDGTTVAACGGGWAGIELSNLAGGKVVNVEAGSYINGDLTIAGNGSLLFHDWDDGIVRSDLHSDFKGIDGHAFPADDPAMSLAFRKGKNKPELVIFSNSDPKPLITLRDLPELGKDSKLSLHDRIHLIPRGHVLITVGHGGDQLILRKFDLAEELTAEGTDFLFVNSAPVCSVERGKAYSYKISTLSKKGGVQLALQSGPKGMTISKDGTIHWPVPARFDEDHVEVIVQISDASGQSVFHSYSINVMDHVTRR